jgi:hypothetical protein
MRGSEHSKDLRLYDVTQNSLVVRDTLYDYRGIITGVAQRHQRSEAEGSRERAEHVIQALKRVLRRWRGVGGCGARRDVVRRSQLVLYASSQLTDNVGYVAGTDVTPSANMRRPGV